MEHGPLQAYLDELADLPDFMGIELMDVNTRGFFGTTPLDVAACRGDCEAARQLLDAGARIDSLVIDDNSPLHQAALHGHENVAALLLERGASRVLRNRDGQTAMDVAQIQGKQGMIKLLLENQK